MEAWQEKRPVQTMNLRSVFTAEQQRILERYYENGMTNQSKSCFQLILQCAQETKLDFSVVRTWVGNKRRKLASKVDQNGGVVSHTVAGSSVGGAASVALLAPEMVGARNVQRGTHLLTPVVSPSPLSSSSPSSSSSHSSGLGNGSNNDVIVTGIYSLARPPALAQAKTDLPVQVHVRPTTQTDGSALHLRPAATPPRRLPQISATCGPSPPVRKPFPPGDAVGMPRNWARQYGPPQPQPWPFSSHPQVASSSTHSSPQPCASDPGVRVQQVFSLAALGEGQHRVALEGGPQRGLAKTRPSDSSSCFSIAMETGDADDEYAREEELASMGAQIQICPAGGAAAGTVNYVAGAHPRMDSPVAPPAGRNPAAVKPLDSDLYGGKGYQSQPVSSQGLPRQNSFPSSTGSCSSYLVRVQQQGSPQRAASLQQVSSNLSAPWITSNSRKRTLQDRTQFSDRDLHTLKRYWDKGMTSLGSVCREKISAAATELSVDSEIIKTWIGNRRRKYRLMGIEIPPPKGGPAVFAKQSGMESPRSLTSEGDEVNTPDPGEDSERTDEVSICLSEDGASDTIQREDDEDVDGEAGSGLADNVKIEIIDDEDEDNECDVIGPNMEHVQNLLEFKQEEVRYLESELENQKQKYYKLQIFTKNLLSAVKNMDQEKQQELLVGLPQELEEDWEVMSEQEAEPSTATISNSNSSVSEETGATGSL